MLWRIEFTKVSQMTELPQIRMYFSSALRGLTFSMM